MVVLANFINRLIILLVAVHIVSLGGQQQRLAKMPSDYESFIPSNTEGVISLIDISVDTFGDGPDDMFHIEVNDQWAQSVCAGTFKRSRLKDIDCQYDIDTVLNIGVNTFYITITMLGDIELQPMHFVTGFVYHGHGNLSHSKENKPVLAKIQIQKLKQVSGLLFGYAAMNSMWLSRGMGTADRDEMKIISSTTSSASPPPAVTCTSTSTSTMSTGTPSSSSSSSSASSSPSSSSFSIFKPSGSSSPSSCCRGWKPILLSSIPKYWRSSCSFLPVHEAPSFSSTSVTASTALQGRAGEGKGTRGGGLLRKHMNYWYPLAIIGFGSLALGYKSMMGGTRDGRNGGGGGRGENHEEDACWRGKQHVAVQQQQGRRRRRSSEQTVNSVATPEKSKNKIDEDDGVIISNTTLS